MLGALLLAGLWLGWQSLEIWRHLRAARAGVPQVQQALLAGDVPRARAEAAEVAAETARARKVSSGFLWRYGANVPLLGDNLRAVTVMAEVADEVASDAVPKLLDAGAAFDAAGLRPTGRDVDLGRLAQVQPALQAASADLDAAYGQVRDLRGLSLVPPLAGVVKDVQTGLGDVREVTRDAAAAGEVLPAILGADGPRKYFLAFQNNAEARGTGGLLGAYGILDVREGRMRVRHMGSNTELQQVAADLPVPLGAQFRNRYGDDPALWVNANMSPHFPYAARIWLELWERQTGERLDGVVAIDPVALGYVLGATGPARLPGGGEITAGNATQLTMSEVYARFPRPEQDQRRDAYLRHVALSAFHRLFSGSGDSADLVRAIARAADEGRLLVYSAHPAEERLIADTVVGGELANDPGPRVAVVVNNVGGGKLDYYLDRAIRYHRRGCLDERRLSTLTVTLRNTAPDSGLPEYVTARVDKQGSGRRDLAGHDRLRTSVFLPMGSNVLAGTMDGGPLRLSHSRERGRPAVDYVVDLAPGEASRVVLHLDEPPTPGNGRVEVQPMARPADVEIGTSAEPVRCG